MKRTCLLVALTLFAPFAYAGEGLSFSIGGHRVHLDSARCRSLSCVSVSDRSRRDDGGDNGRMLNPVPAPAAIPVTPAASPPPGRPDGSSDLAAKYAAALQEAIARQWTRPDNVPIGQRCRIYITQLPGGEVINVEFDAGCPYDALGRRSVEAAVRRAAPLPYAGFEDVFNRRLNLNFTAQDR